MHSVEEMEDCSFAPAISGKSAELVEARVARQEESYLDRIVRLSYSDRQHNSALKEVAEAEFYSQFKYKPTITRKGEATAASSVRGPAAQPSVALTTVA